MIKLLRAVALVKPAMPALWRGIQATTLTACLFGSASGLAAQSQPGTPPPGPTDLSGSAWDEAIRTYRRAAADQSSAAADWIQAANELQQFRVQASSDKHVPEAKASEALALLRAAELGGQVPAEQIASAVALATQDERLPSHERLTVASRARELAIETGPKMTFRERLEAYEASARAMIVSFPQEREPYEALAGIAEDQPDVPTALRIVADLLGNAATPAEVKARAEIVRRREALVGTKLDWSLLNLSTEARAALKGQAVVLYLWSYNNGDSVRMAKWLRQLEGKDVSLVGVSLDPRELAARAAAYNGNFPGVQVVAAAGGCEGLADGLVLTKVPAIYLVDGKGVIRDVRGLHDLTRKVAALTKEVR